MGQNGLNGYHENVDDKESRDCLLESDHTDNGRCKIFCLNCWLSQYTHTSHTSASQQNINFVRTDTVPISLATPVSDLLIH